MPSTFWRRSFTGNTVPPNGFDTRFHMIVRPTLPGRSLAPMTATISGRKMASSGSRSYPRTSCAGSAFLRFFMGASLQPARRFSFASALSGQHFLAEVCSAMFLTRLFS